MVAQDRYQGKMGSQAGYLLRLGVATLDDLLDNSLAHLYQLLEIY
jgi:hypothetical protein